MICYINSERSCNRSQARCGSNPGWSANLEAFRTRVWEEASDSRSAGTPCLLLKAPVILRCWHCSLSGLASQFGHMPNSSLRRNNSFQLCSNYSFLVEDPSDSCCCFLCQGRGTPLNLVIPETTKKLNRCNQNERDRLGDFAFFHFLKNVCNCVAVFQEQQVAGLKAVVTTVNRESLLEFHAMLPNYVFIGN